ncbi:unnamed protein product, partial [Choristocarpus tenellus]
PRRRHYCFLRFRVYGLAVTQIQCAWKAFQQNTIFKMSTR